MKPPVVSVVVSPLQAAALHVHRGLTDFCAGRIRDRAAQDAHRWPLMISVPLHRSAGPIVWGRRETGRRAG